MKNVLSIEDVNNCGIRNVCPVRLLHWWWLAHCRQGLGKAEGQLLPLPTHWWPKSLIPDAQTLQHFVQVTTLAFMFNVHHNSMGLSSCFVWGFVVVFWGAGGIKCVCVLELIFWYCEYTSTLVSIHFYNLTVVIVSSPLLGMHSTIRLVSSDKDLFLFFIQ